MQLVYCKGTKLCTVQLQGFFNFPPIPVGNKTVEGIKISYPIAIPPVSVETLQWK